MIHRPIHYEELISAFCRLGKIARNLYRIGPEINLEVYVITAHFVLVDNRRPALLPHTDGAPVNEIVADDIALVVERRPHADRCNTRFRRWTAVECRIQNSHILHVVARDYGKLQSSPTRVGGSAPHVPINEQSPENSVRRVDHSASSGLVYVNSDTCQPTSVNRKICDLEPIDVLHVD